MQYLFLEGPLDGMMINVVRHHNEPAPVWNDIDSGVQYERFDIKIGLRTCYFYIYKDAEKSLAFDKLLSSYQTKAKRNGHRTVKKGIRFEKWWQDVGRHLDPCPTVPWDKKLMLLASYSFEAGKTTGISNVDANLATRKFVVLLGRIEKYLKLVLRKEEHYIARLNLESDYKSLAKVLVDLHQISEN